MNGRYTFQSKNKTSMNIKKLSSAVQCSSIMLCKVYQDQSLQVEINHQLLKHKKMSGLLICIEFINDDDDDVEVKY